MKHLPRIPAAALAAALALGLAPTPAPAVTFFSDRAIENVATRLRLPEGATVTMPRGRAARVEELADLAFELDAAQQVLAAREPGAFASRQAREAAVAAFQAFAPSPEERAALAADGLAGLSPDRRAEFEALAAPVTESNAELRAYFQAYDHFQRTKIRAQVMALALDVAQKRHRLDGHIKGRKARKLDKAIGAFTEQERRFRIFMSHPSAKNHHRALASIVCQRRGAQVVGKLDEALADAGLAPEDTTKPGWFKTLGREVKSLARVAKAGLTALPGAARVLGYLYNPFRKEADPAKAIGALRSVSKGYRKGAELRLDVEGQELIPEGQPVVFAFSHRSEFEDAVLMLGAVPGEPYSFMMGQWAFPSFLNHKLAAEPTTINVGGSKKDGTKVNAVREGIDVLKQKKNLVIFPEGMTPTDLGETQEVRTGIDVITRAVSAEPVSVVGVTLADPANRPGGPRHVSMGGPVTIKARFHAPLDPLLLSLVPEAGADAMRNLLRVRWHQDLFGEGTATSLEFSEGVSEALQPYR